MSSKTTQFGFKWDEEGIRLVVQRSFNDKKMMCITVLTDAGAIDIGVTPSGRIRTHMKKPGAKKAAERIDKDYLKKTMEQ